eukprot:2015514-Prymnesium_polylepis.1
MSSARAHEAGRWALQRHRAAHRRPEVWLDTYACIFAGRPCDIVECTTTCVCTTRVEPFVSEAMGTAWQRGAHQSVRGHNSSATQSPQGSGELAPAGQK